MQQLITDIPRGNYDIVFITETWLSSKQLSSNFDIPGYDVHRRYCCRLVGLVVVYAQTFEIVLISLIFHLSVYQQKLKLNGRIVL